MASKTKVTKKTVKPAAKKPAAKVSPKEKKTAPAVKKSVKKPVAKTTPKAKTAASLKPGGLKLIQSVKTGVQTGLDAVSELVKKLTSNAPKPAVKRAKRK